jgi:hypothetical protein
MAMTCRASALACAALALAVIACSQSTRSAGPSGAAPASATTVIVENNNWLDMNVYVLRSGARLRLGTVPSIATRRFALPAGATIATNDVRLEADPIGSSRSFVSSPIPFIEGDDIIWRLENYLPLSSFRTQPGRR